MATNSCCAPQTIQSPTLQGRMPHVGSLYWSGRVCTTLVRDRQATAQHTRSRTWSKLCNGHWSRSFSCKREAARKAENLATVQRIRQDDLNVARRQCLVNIDVTVAMAVSMPKTDMVDLILRSMSDRYLIWGCPTSRSARSTT